MNETADRLRFATDSDLDGVPELRIPTVGNVASLGLFPARFNRWIYVTESGLWRLYLWNHGLVRRKVQPH
jgi:hypothetical protein